jgi:glycosyltransferase involved in cell wall biosynthesis
MHVDYRQRRSLSVVVIGRNDERRLADTYTGAYLESLRGVAAELIYVDSASDDRSCQVMQDRGFEVIRLSPQGVLSAAAGRQQGTIAASAVRILYLDSDMRVAEVAQLNRVLGDLEESPFDGVVGEVIDVFPDGRRRKRIRKRSSSGDASSFGGFLIMSREAVLEVGNWDPGMLANEEIELYARLRRAGSRVGYIPELVVLHETQLQASQVQRLAALYLPWVRPRQYGAFGSAVRASIRSGSFVWMVRLVPEPFLLVVMILAVAIGIEISDWTAAVVTASVYEFTLLRRRSWKFNLVVPAMVMSFPYGFIRYRSRNAVVSIDATRDLN